VAYHLRRLYPEAWQTKGYLRLLAHPATLAALQNGAVPESIVRSWRKDLEGFLAVRKKYLMYE
jgi:uncharacterized protein YbbC (DUF1343 family)